MKSLALLLAAVFQLGAQGPRYVLVDLGPNTQAKAINDLGQVAGVYAAGNNVVRPFRTAPNSVINLATDDLGIVGNVAGMNNSGQVIGDSLSGLYRTAPNKPFNLATDLLGTAGSFATTSVTGINDEGRVVGFGFTGGGQGGARAFRTAPNSPIQPGTDLLGTRGGRFTRASSINSSGQVTGTASLVDGPTGPIVTGAFRSDASAVGPLLTELNILGGPSSIGYDINDAGQVVGSSTISIQDPTVLHAFRTGPNMSIHPGTDDLGTLGGTYGSALAINNAGVVVGESSTAAGRLHAFIYTGGAMHDLNDLVAPAAPFELTTASDINAKGQIVANGGGHGFRLDPLTTIAIAIKGGAGPANINTKSNGKIPVGILSSQAFNALVRVDQTKLTFGRTGKEASLAFCSGAEDLNDDGLLDLMCHFYTAGTGFKPGDTKAVLTGVTLDGVGFEGSASVRVK
jgi:probable HAF family extracellular repeat protein